MSAWHELGARLSRELAALSEPLQRELRLIEWLGQVEPARAVHVLGAIIEAAEQRDVYAQSAWLALMSLRRHETTLGYERLADLYRHADELGLEPVKQLMLAGPPKRSAPRGGVDNERVNKTLGERISMALSADRDVIDRLLRDRHPRVIARLLQNPRLREVDVVRLCAQRPLEPAVAEVVVQAPKWLARYPVKRALVLNPYTPTNLALSLLAALTSGDLRLAVSELQLSDSVREQARRRLEGNRARLLH